MRLFDLRAILESGSQNLIEEVKLSQKGGEPLGEKGEGRKERKERRERRSKKKK